MTDGNLEDAKSKLESLVIYLAKNRHFAAQQYAEADKALTDATSALVSVENSIAHPIVYVPPGDESISSTPIGDTASFGYDLTRQNMEPVNLDK